MWKCQYTPHSTWPLWWLGYSALEHWTRPVWTPVSLLWGLPGGQLRPLPSHQYQPHILPHPPPSPLFSRWHTPCPPPMCPWIKKLSLFFFCSTANFDKVVSAVYEKLKRGEEISGLQDTKITSQDGDLLVFLKISSGRWVQFCKVKPTPKRAPNSITPALLCGLPAILLVWASLNPVAGWTSAGSPGSTPRSHLCNLWGWLREQAAPCSPPPWLIQSAPDWVATSTSTGWPSPTSHPKPPTTFPRGGSPSFLFSPTDFQERRTR